VKFTIGGTVTGLTGSGLILQNNGGDDLPVSAGVGAFTFTTSIARGLAYNVGVFTQPSSPPQTCSVTNGQGTVMGAHITNISVNCVNTFTLTVTKAGTGSGTVTSNPAGINCGDTCLASYNSGTSVTLTATPAAGSIFTGWTGGGCTGTGACVVTMNAAQSITATFTPPQPFTKVFGFDDGVLRITLAGDGSGDIYVGGGFTTYNGTLTDRIARLAIDGTVR